ncbi:MAG: hypothetical protein K9N07_11410 [Candidatus Cloacimonetes bacterium]|nr:hypothetical protein [Candidatus Cloacimonadota bacterium]
MKKEGEASAEKPVLTTILDFASGLFSGLSGNVVERISDVVEKKEKKLLELLVEKAVFLISLIFICIAAVLIISQYLELHMGWSFLIIGLMLLVWSFSLRTRG